MELDPGTILVCFAVPQEARPFRRLAPAGMRIVVTGIGERRTRAAVERALSTPGARPNAVLTCGYAGGLDPALKAGEVLFDASPDFPLAGQLAQAGARRGRFHCAGAVASTAAEKRLLRQQTGADAVEMESGVIREMAQARGIPAATVRVISDEAAEDLPMDFNAVTGPDGGLSPMRLAGALVVNPRLIPRLMAFGRRTGAAAEALAGVLGRTLAVLGGRQ